MSIAIITGASSGIGREFAKQLKELCSVNEFWFVARREDRMKAIAEELGVEAHVISADLTTTEGIERIRTELSEKKPEVSFLVNAAGFGKFGGFDEIDEDNVAKMIDLNDKALVLITHMVIPYMVKGGRIIELGSGSCFTPLPYFNVYAASKAFVLHYTKALNFEIKKYGLRATCFCPGWVDTEFLPLSKSIPGATVPKAMKPLLKVEDVVRGCVKASVKGRAMYVTNWYTKLQHMLFKLVPDCLLSKTWLGMLTKNPPADGE